MGNTATITHEKATTTSFALGADGRIVIAGQNTGPRTQDYDHTALTAAAKACPDGSEGQEMYSSRAESIAALDSAEVSKRATAIPSPAIKPGQP